jgi:hypothetical protein
MKRFATAYACQHEGELRAGDGTSRNKRMILEITNVYRDAEADTSYIFVTNAIYLQRFKL